MLSNKLLVQRKEAGFYVNPAGPLADFIVDDVLVETQLYHWSSHSEGGAVKIKNSLTFPPINSNI